MTSALHLLYQGMNNLAPSKGSLRFAGMLSVVRMLTVERKGGGVPAERLPTLGSILERTTSAKGRSCSSFRLSAGTGGSANETEMKN